MPDQYFITPFCDVGYQNLVASFTPTEFRGISLFCSYKIYISVRILHFVLTALMLH